MNKNNFIIKTKKDWLESRGGRTLADINKDEKGEYVFMGNGRGGKMKVYIPKQYEQT
jgi:hypothetical protein